MAGAAAGRASGQRTAAGSGQRAAGCSGQCSAASGGGASPSLHNARLGRRRYPQARSRGDGGTRAVAEPLPSRLRRSFRRKKRSACPALQRAIGEATVLFNRLRPGFPAVAMGRPGGSRRKENSKRNRALRHGRPNPAPTLVEIQLPPAYAFHEDLTKVPTARCFFPRGRPRRQCNMPVTTVARRVPRKLRPTVL